MEFDKDLWIVKYTMEFSSTIFDSLVSCLSSELSWRLVCPVRPSTALLDPVGCCFILDAGSHLSSQIDRLFLYIWFIFVTACHHLQCHYLQISRNHLIILSCDNLIFPERSFIVVFRFSPELPNILRCVISRLWTVE